LLQPSLKRSAKSDFEVTTKRVTLKVRSNEFLLSIVDLNIIFNKYNRF